MRLRTGVEDMQNLRSAGGRRVGDERPMTLPRHRFGAHYRRRFGLRRREQVVERTREFSCFHVIGVSAKPGISPQRVVRITSHFPPTAERGKMRISHHVLGKPALQLVSVEVRVSRRCGKGAHIDEMRHAFPFQETKELFESPGRMSDGVEPSGVHAPRSFLPRPEATPTAE